jgi:hypothetical protein
MVSGERVSAAGAALANGFMANALDIDDGYRSAKGHPGACALPPLLAAAELAGDCRGDAFLTALVIAYELGIRAGVIRHATYACYHSSGSWGAIAGAAAVGKLLAFSEDRLLHAMGAAEYHAPIAPQFETEFPAKALAEVVVETTAGRVFRSGRVEARWEPPDSLPTDGELEEKFRWLAEPVIGAGPARALSEAIWRADRWSNLDPILKGLRSRR